jgi:putative ABC transport system permease protein
MEDWTALVRARLTEAAGGPPDSDVVEELAAHLAQAYEDAIGDGASREQARAKAIEVLRASAQLREALRAHEPRAAQRIDQWIREEPLEIPIGSKVMKMIDIRRDARYALRMLLRAPAFSLIAIVIFAVGIGANAAVFSVVNGVLLRPLPYPAADRITMLWCDNRPQGIKEDITSYPNYRDWRDQNTTYAQMAAYSLSAFNLTGAGEPERLNGAAVTANFFDVMGLSPVLGRVFTQANETEGRDAVVVLSYGLWQRRFGGARDVLGKTIALSGRPHEVIGVMPPELRWPEDTEVWTPLAVDKEDREARGAFWLPVVGRLKPGVSFVQAQTEMTGISNRLEQTYPTNKGFGINVVPLQQQIVGNIQPVLLVLMGAVGFVLLIACANLANLLLGRTAARRKELAIRIALGAGRARVVRQLVTEVLVLAVLGGALGVLLARWSIQMLISLGGDIVPRPDAIVIDARVLAFTLLVATISAVIAALLPALHASRAAVADHLREGGREGGATSGRRTRSLLVAAEVSLALILLTGAGLLVRTMWSMERLNRGFDPNGIATARISLPGSSYRDAAVIRTFYTRLLERVRALPGVESAATGTAVLMPLVTNSGNWSIEGKPAPPPGQQIEYPFETVSPGYFETLRIELVRGRTFTAQDHADAPRVVVINETLARMGWPDQDPIGRHIRPGGINSNAPWFTVIGVIKDVHRGEVKRAIRPELYMCSLQRTPRTQMLLIRTAGQTPIIADVRRVLQDLDPQLPLFAVGTLSSQLSTTLNQPRFQATVLGGFAAIALLLASLGIYGVTSHAVTQRKQEVGIRMALGARRADVLGLIVRDHLRPAIAGVAVGLAGALLLTRFLQTLLYGVRATDPITFASVSAALILVALAACWLPARRATRVDPLIALRAE